MSSSRDWVHELEFEQLYIRTANRRNVRTLQDYIAFYYMLYIN